MNVIDRMNRAVRYIEEHLTDDITIFDAAKQAFLSPYHFLRIFQATTGQSLGEYIRKRKMTVAAQNLLSTEQRIIDLAFDLGFESQEAFTRAFKKHFGITPARFRKAQSLPILLERKPLSESTIHHLKGGITMEPKIVEKKAFKVVGMKRTTSRKNNTVPQLWQEFLPRVQEIRNAISNQTLYGICLMNESVLEPEKVTEETEFEELVCMEVSDFGTIPQGMVTHELPTQKYAVFTHKGSLENLFDTYDYIYGTWVNKTEHELTLFYDFELYDQRFDMQNPAQSELDIYVPIK